MAVLHPVDVLSAVHVMSAEQRALLLTTLLESCPLEVRIPGAGFGAFNHVAVQPSRDAPVPAGIQSVLTVCDRGGRFLFGVDAAGWRLFLPPTEDGRRRWLNYSGRAPLRIHQDDAGVAVRYADRRGEPHTAALAAGFPQAAEAEVWTAADGGAERHRIAVRDGVISYVYAPVRNWIETEAAV